MKVLAIIPARRGSKGIKNKNIMRIAGRPLIAYTIDVALRAQREGLIDKVIVSTDGNDIARVARRYGAEVPFLRPRNISGDKAKSIDFVLHALNFFESKNICFDAVLVLQPTTPLREVHDIRAAISVFKSGKAESLITCYRDRHLSESILYHRQRNRAIAWSPRHNRGYRRQDEKDIYVRSGAMYLAKVAYLRKFRRLFSNNPFLYEMAKGKSINIDSPEDLKILKGILCG